MSRKLEKFISNNRNEFDDQEPSGKVWENLSETFNKKGKKTSVLVPFLRWSIAAAILVTAGTAIYFYLHDNKSEKEIIASTNNDTSSDINSIAPEYAPQVNEFAKLVALKQDELRSLAPEQPELYKQFTTDIIQLDSSYRSLKDQLRISPNREMLIEAMIQNLQLQLNVLNQQLNIINQIKTKKSSHEKDIKTI